MPYFLVDFLTNYYSLLSIFSLTPKQGIIKDKISTAKEKIMKLSLAEVEHIAKLARLELTAEEKERYQQQLSAILDYATSLQALDTEGIAPTASVLPERSVLRADEARPGLSLADVLRNAPQSEEDQFRVPPVLE